MGSLRVPLSSEVSRGAGHRLQHVRAGEKTPSQVCSNTLSRRGLASFIRVGVRESRGEQPEQVTLQPRKAREGEIIYMRRNVCYHSI